MGTVVICRTVKVMVPRYSYKANELNGKLENIVFMMD